MSIKRTVSNGRDFSQSVKSAILGGGKFCVCCKRERATQVDHIHALQFGGSSDIDNATALCGRCHFEKSRAEANANTAAQVERIIKRFQKLTFTPGGKRRTIKPGRDTEAAQWARKIRAKRQGNHKLAAKLRRDASGGLTPRLTACCKSNIVSYRTKLENEEHKMRAIALFGVMVATILLLLCMLKIGTEGVLFGWIVMDITFLTVIPMAAIFFLVHACEAR